MKKFIFGTGFVALLILVSLACGLSGVPTAPTTDPNILFQDDFSSTSSGWDQSRDEAGITDYDQGGYRIQVLESDFDYWSNPGLNFDDVSIRVVATKLGGPDENDFGVICRYQDIENFYFFILGNDGYYGIGKVKNGEQTLVGMDTMQPNDAINQGEEATNEIRADCEGNHLTLYANGTLLADVQDSDFNAGDVGLIAGTFDEPGTDVLFDDFAVRKP